jgi:hypothetical protein
LSLFQRIAGAALGILLFVAALFFASVVLAAAALLALGVWGWLWWKTRDLRKAAARAEGTVIEGEYRVEREATRIDDDTG